PARRAPRLRLSGAARWRPEPATGTRRSGLPTRTGYQGSVASHSPIQVLARLHMLELRDRQVEQVHDLRLGPCVLPADLLDPLHEVVQAHGIEFLRVANDPYRFE